MLQRIWNALRENRWVLISTLLALSAGLLIGASVRPDGEGQEPSAGEAAQVDRIGLQSILPETKIHMEYEFKDCLHSVTVELETMPHIGQTEKDFLADHPNGTILKFSAEEVAARSELPGPCPRHVLLKADSDGDLHIYQTNISTLTQDCLQSLPLHVDAFDPETAEDLYQGLVFESVAGVDQYLENMES